MTDAEFLELLTATKEAFEKSDIRRVAEQCGRRWFYHVAATRIVPGRPLLLGFNWGASKRADYHEPVSPPRDTFRELLEARELGSFARLAPYLVKHLPDVPFAEFGQSNYCFFRSETADQISGSDLELCRPLIDRLLEVAKPKMILGFSKRLRDYLTTSVMLPAALQESPPICLTRGSYKSAVGTMTIKADSLPIAFLPHPNFPMPRHAREQAWQFCFPTGDKSPSDSGA